MATSQRTVFGFTLVELQAAVVITGALAAIAIPNYLQAVERAKSVEAFNYLATIHAAMEQHRAMRGKYPASVSMLDIQFTPLEYFDVGTVHVSAGNNSLETGWEIVLTRSGPSGGYGAYTVVFTQDGLDEAKSTIPAEISPYE